MIRKCSEDVMVVVKNNPGAYQRIKDAFDNNVIGYMIRVIMTNPLHIDLPPLVVLSIPTCNKFDHTDVQRQWVEVDDLYNEHIKPVLGWGLIGHSSDGGSRRRTFMHYQAQSNDGERYRPVDYEEGFLYSVGKIPDPDD